MNGTSGFQEVRSLPPDYHRIGSCTSGSIDSEQVSGSFFVFPISLLPPQASTQSEKKHGPTFKCVRRSSATMPVKEACGLLLPFLLLMTLLVVPEVNGQERENTLFSALLPEDRVWAEQNGREKLKNDKTLNGVEYVRFESGGRLEKVLRGGLKGLPIPPIIIQIPKIQPVIYVTKLVSQQSQGFIAWSGYVQDDPASFVSFVLRESAFSPKKEAVLYGTVVVEGKTFRIFPEEKGIYAVVDIDTSKFPPEAPPKRFNGKPKSTLPEEPLIPWGTKYFVPWWAAYSAYFRASLIEPIPVFLKSCVIDVLVVYSQGARDETADIDEEIQYTIARANAIYEASGAMQRLNLVNQFEVNYEPCVEGICYQETGDVESDLNNLISAHPTVTPTPSPSDTIYPLRAIHQWRDALSADIVAMWVSSSDQTYCGVSYLLPEDPEQPGTFLVAGDPPFSENAFSVVQRNCALNNYSMDHEFGHLGGGDHDRGYIATEESLTSSAIANTFYHYGFAYPFYDYGPPSEVARVFAPGNTPAFEMGEVAPTSEMPALKNMFGPETEHPWGNWRTIMALNLRPGKSCPMELTCCTDCQRIPRWSNPHKYWWWNALGIEDRFPPPPLTSTPILELSADDLRTLNNSAAILSAFRSPSALSSACRLVKDTQPPISPSN